MEKGLDSKDLIKKLLNQKIEEGKFTNLAAGVGLAAGALFGGNAHAQSTNPMGKIKDKIHQVDSMAREKISQLKGDIKQNQTQETNTLEAITKKYDNMSKMDNNVAYGIGESSNQSFAGQIASQNALRNYMQKNNIKQASVSKQNLEHHTFQKQDGTYVVISIFNFN